MGFSPLKNGKIDGHDSTNLEGNFEKILKNQIEIFWNCNDQIQNCLI